MNFARPIAAFAASVLLLNAHPGHAATPPATRPTVLNARVEPTWTDASHFWYRRTTANGGSEVVTVDAATGSRTVASDAPPTTAPASRPGPGNGTSRPARQRRDAGMSRDLGRPFPSPDRKHVAFIRDGNVYAGAAADSAKAVSTDGTPAMPYDRLFWSPDSKSIVAYRIERGDHKDVYRLESAPLGANGKRDGSAGRAILHTDEYTLPGDKLDSFALSLFDAETGKQTTPPVDRVDADQWGSHPSPTPRWRNDGRRFTYEKYDRGHQRVRLMEVDSATGDVRTLIDESTKTFIWTAHTEGLKLRLFNYLSNDREVIYVSEQSGWRHVYLLDVESGSLKPITGGEWVFRDIVRIDETKRQIIFAAGGVYPGQDPYLVHYGRVNFDGTGLTWLTDANGNHALDARRPELNFSPDGDYLVITHSRVDRPPVTELRRTSDGKLVTTLETAEVKGDWRPLEVFSAKGRDGKTDIWGVIRRPKDFDPNKKYPIVENVYAGPQSAYVPKVFRAEWYYDGLADKGFVVVQIDGMGTALRSKAFHDVCWQNLADAGFPDRIAWIKAAAQKYPWMDVSRVGIYGTSAGGQNAAGALLFHNDFYKAAVANCGCHDNRMDKISWNEQWMGYPVGPHYSASSNIDNAAKLKGRLQLVLGEMDNNVPVESTYRLVDALVRAGKEFDFGLIPGSGHGAGSPVTQRKLEDFFVRWLQGTEPANPNG